MDRLYAHIRGKNLSRLCLIILSIFLMACAAQTDKSAAQPSPTSIPAGTPTGPVKPLADTCPDRLQRMENCQTPHSMQVAYGMQSLLAHGFTGKGQTVVDIVSYGSPTLQKDMDVFSKQFGLPAITLQIQAPLGTAQPDPKNKDMDGWAEETTLDVEIIHAMAPDAGIVVLTSPVDETEGTVGMPEFLKLEQYAVEHKLGQIFSQSYVASEPTLADAQGQDLIKTYTDFYKQIASQGWTVVTGSGDHGATDYSNLEATKFSTTPIVNFPADVPWVTAVGGTALVGNAPNLVETAWGSGDSGSGGGYSKVFSMPDYQKSLPESVQSQMDGQRGLPDVAANADPTTAMAIYYNGLWLQVGGTSAATPTWAGILAVANQMAGHPLGFINPGLYKVAASAEGKADFRDITTGNNSFTQAGVQVKGYQAVPGWDAVTGLGAPIADKLLPDLIASLRS